MLYSCRQVKPEQVQLVLQSHSEGCRLQRISRLTGLAYNTVVRIIRSASTCAQLIHNQEIQKVKAETVSGNEMWSFVEKNQRQYLPEELEVGDCWIGVSLAEDSRLILSARVGKHTDELIEELVVSTEGKTTYQEWNTDDWGGHEHVLTSKKDHYTGKKRPKQTGRWHWRQNKFGKD